MEMIDDATLFLGRKLLVASMHNKHQVIAPIFKREWSSDVVCSADLDTDQFGTFSGEVERKLDPMSSAIAKCRLGLRLSGLDLGVATEGSFGPHPSLPWMAAHEEWMVLVDEKNELVISKRKWSIDTNFNHAKISNEDELFQFAERAQFPSHALILRSKKDDGSQEILKGINEAQILRDSFHRMNIPFSELTVETDMRAHFNPTRMKVIEELTIGLMQKAVTPCPECKKNGFGEQRVEPGLPCGQCGLPTSSPLYKITTCISCGFESKELNPDGKPTEDPMYCSICNP
ncbi:MAG: hypothetical protein RLY35_173 [Bacteroidota bacterium]